MDSLYLDGNLKLAGTHSLKEARNIILGVPADYTQSNRVGARYAPLEIRRQFLELEKEWDRISFHDLGDVEPVLGDMKATCKRLAEVLSEVKSDSSATPIILGGEHTITYGAVKALKPDVVVFLDAHMDLKDEYLSQPFCHATVARRIRELGVGLVQVGVRTAASEEREYASKEGVLELSCEDARKLASKIKGRRAYVSVDLDVLDPSVAPGVGNPEPSGMSFNTLSSLIHTASESCRVAGFDFVEACPTYDAGLSCLAAAKLTLEILEGR